MTIVYLLIPLSLILTAAAIAAFFWAVRSGQFDDLHTPALKILDDEQPELTEQTGAKVMTPPDPIGEKHPENQGKNPESKEV